MTASRDSLTATHMLTNTATTLRVREIGSRHAIVRARVTLIGITTTTITTGTTTCGAAAG